MRQELYDVLQAVDAAVRDGRPAVAGRVPPEDWDGWETVLAALGMTDRLHVVALAREAVTKIQQQLGAAAAEDGPHEDAPELEDGGGVAEDRPRQGVQGNVPVCLGARIVDEVHVDSEGAMFEIWSPMHGGYSWVTEAVFRAEFEGAAESMLNRWRAPQGARLPTGAGEFSPREAESLLGGPGPGGPPLRTSIRTRQSDASPACPPARRPGEQSGSGGQPAGREGDEAQATDRQLPAGGRQSRPRTRSPAADRRAVDGVECSRQQGRQSPASPPEETRGHGPQPRQQAPPVHIDDHDPNSSYCNPEAAAALWKTFTATFAQAFDRKQQSLQEQILLARHSALFEARRAPRAGADGQNPGADLEGAAEKSGHIAEGAPLQQRKLGRRRASAPGPTTGPAAPHVVVGVGAAARAAGASQRRGLAAAAAGTVPSALGTQAPLPARQQEAGEKQGRKKGGRRCSAADVAGAAAAAAAGARAEDGGAAQRPGKRRRRLRDEGGAAGRRDGDGTGASPAEAQRQAGPARARQPQPGAAQKPAPPNPALPGRTVDSPMLRSPASSAGVTISDSDSAGTPAADAAVQSRAPVGAPDAVDTARVQHAQPEPEPPRRRPAIIPSDEARAAWKKLGEVLRACRAAAAQYEANDAGAGAAQQAAARNTAAQQAQRPDGRTSLPVAGQPQSNEEPFRTQPDLGMAGQVPVPSAERAAPGLGTASASPDAALTAAAIQHGAQPRDESAPEPLGAGEERRDDEGGVQDEARDADEVQRAARQAGRNGPPEEPPGELMRASQGVQTSQWLLDSWVLDMQQRQQAEPSRHAVAVQTSQAPAQPLLLVPPLPASEAQQSYQQQQQQPPGPVGPPAPPPAVLSESPPVGADPQPLGSQALHYGNQAGTVVGVKVAQPQPERQQQPGKPPRRGRRHDAGRGSCRPVPATEPSATPAVAPGGAAAEVQPGAVELRAQERSAAEEDAAAQDSTAAAAAPPPADGDGRAAAAGLQPSRGALLEDVQTWMGRKCAPLVATSPRRDGRNPPLRPADGRRTVGGGGGGDAGDGDGGQGQDCQRAPPAATDVVGAGEMEGQPPPMARDALIGPPQLGGGQGPAPMDTAAAALEAATGVAPGPGASVGAGGSRGAAVEQPGSAATAAALPGAQVPAEQLGGGQQALDSDAGAAAGPAAAAGAGAGAGDPEAAAGPAGAAAGDAELQQQQQQQVAAAGYLAPQEPSTEVDEFVLMSAPPDFFTQPLSQPFY
ncbi:hypothetical protein PLESTB_000616800 [Pleodorina starrii]|uniref:Uncharacterized protein n=1 Tax=Pleodorina starrii TaxID=330485 RepID=A0A9W6BIQ0_9CHLO|nr:hypothetical protein PLESTM_001736200 [Pleodorina starrii]GLC52327.1 hypothetical protein PLESTB_000616800 [Pleodorina starrii]GLC68002.1 hypothetical protein PLESTF_000633400 [Pleodorina starrii]